MKAMRKNIGRLIVGCVLACCLSLSTLQTFAIEQLAVSVQSTNAVLSWPSATNETYLVQFTTNLNLSYPWLTLTDSFPAASSGVLTYFTNFNSVTYLPYSGITNGNGNPNPTNTVSGGTNTFSTTSGFYRVVRDGTHLWGITNGMVLHDVLITPIEFSVGNTDQIVGVTFYDENNSPIIGASAQGSGNYWTLVWNTLQSFNGDYNIYAEIDFATSNSVVSQPVSVTVSNVISFPNYFSQVFGDEMWIYAQTIPDAAYEIDLYDESTNYLGSFEDYADDSGLISFIWDLTDGYGDTFDSTNFFGVFTVTYSTSNVRPNLHKQGSSPVFQRLANKNLSNDGSGGGARPNDIATATANQLWSKEPAWTPNNNWVVTYASLTGDSSVDQRATQMIVGGAGSPEDYGGVLGTLDPYGLNGNLSPGNAAQAGTVFTLQDKPSRTNLLGYLADHRYENFYFFGHGSGSAISAYNGPQTGITRDQLAFDLGNVPLSYSGPNQLILDPPMMVPSQVFTQIQRAALHPYRFVWIDACDTGAGNFCEAFGIPAITASTNFFAAAGVESRAFIGFQQPTGFDTSNSSGDPNSWPNRSSMIANFLQAWLGGVDLNTIVNTAKTGTFGYGTPYYYPYQYKMNSSVVIYGAADLTYGIRTRP
jgi:hypothetical protein